MNDKQFKASLLPILVIVFCILIVGMVAGVFALNSKRNAVNVLRVPEESFDPVNPANNTTTIEGGGGVAITIPANLTQMPTIRGFVVRGNNVGIQCQHNCDYGQYDSGDQCHHAGLGCARDESQQCICPAPEGFYSDGRPLRG